MKVLVIEDEISAVQNLEHLLQVIEPGAEVVQVLDSVSDSLDFLSKNQDFDLILVDIHLADGISFEIFEKIQPKAPIIFTTAYDKYAIQAFKLNSVDYLLKPIQETELKNALEKFKRISFQASELSVFENLMSSIQKSIRKYRQSFLIKRGETLIPVNVSDLAVFYIQNGVVRGATFDKQVHIIDEKLEDLEKDLDPDIYFRANRQFIVHRKAIRELNTYFNGRLLVITEPKTPAEIIVSKANAGKMKNWLKEA